MSIQVGGSCGEVAVRSNEAHPASSLEQPVLWEVKQEGGQT